MPSPVCQASGFMTRASVRSSSVVVTCAGPTPVGSGSIVQSASVESLASSGLARVGGTKKVRKAGGVVWDGLEADGKRLKLIRCAPVLVDQLS